jgi:uncharacterized DUF497 family protein
MSKSISVDVAIGIKMNLRWNKKKVKKKCINRNVNILYAVLIREIEEALLLPQNANNNNDTKQ